MTEASDLLGRLLSPEVVRALEQRMAEVAVEAIREERERERGREWLPIHEAAPIYGCTPKALRARVQRRTVPHRREGHRLYVPAVPADNGAEIL